MNCQDVRRLLEPYSDGELDLVRNLEMEAHLTECHECAKRQEHLQSLRSVLASPSLYHHAPAALRSRIQLTMAPVTRGSQQSATRLVAMAAGFLLLVGISATAGMFLFNQIASREERAIEQIVAGHVRSLQVEHMIDVASSDRHTVKPWFHGKLDFAPSVLDLSQQDYRLSGGRLDYLVDRPVAALVYYRRRHAINLFTWPATGDGETRVRSFSHQGFHLRHWQQAGMTYCAISDLNDQELDDFVRLVREQSPASTH